jgi:type II secretory pathway component PulF
LAEDTEIEIYVALDYLYLYLEDGYTLTEALAENTYLTYVIEDVLDEIYAAIEEGSSVKEAVAEYEDDIDSAVITAAYAITDLVVQELEVEVEADSV